MSVFLSQHLLQIDGLTQVRRPEPFVTETDGNVICSTIPRMVLTLERSIGYISRVEPDRYAYFTATRRTYGIP